MQASEEVKFEPKVMCEKLDRRQTLYQAQLENGDILIAQQAPPEVPAHLALAISLSASCCHALHCPTSSLRGTSLQLPCLRAAVIGLLTLASEVMVPDAP